MCSFREKNEKCAGKQIKVQFIFDNMQSFAD